MTGGIDIAAHWAGFETVCFVENNDYCQKVLKKHWPDVPIIGDIRDVTTEAYQEIIAHSNRRLQEQQEGEVQARGNISNSLSEYGESGATNADQPITLITGGFPCQPFSVAGKRAGAEDNRYLWPEMLRVIKEFKPTWVVGENVLGIVDMALDTVCTDLEAEGYEVQPIVLPACGVNAPHRRYRVFIVAYSINGEHRGGRGQGGEKDRVQGEVRETLCRGLPSRASKEPSSPNSKCMGWEERASEGIQSKEQEPERQEFEHLCEGISESETMGNAKQFPVNGITDSRSNTTAIEQEGQKQGTGTVDGTSSENLMVNTMCRRYIPQETEIPTRWNSFINANWWAVEPELGRVAHGIPNRVDRLKCLGNAVVPQQIYPILKAIAEIENESTKA